MDVVEAVVTIVGMICVTVFSCVLVHAVSS